MAVFSRLLLLYNNYSIFFGPCSSTDRVTVFGTVGGGSIPPKGAMLIGYILYFLVLIFELVFSFALAVYLFSLLYSSFKGSPYVPTKNKECEYFLQQAQLKKGQVFYDLGCGDGRIVRTAVERYQVKGTGFDINPLLIRYARLLARRKKVNGVTFITKNIFAVNLKKADVVYIFLMPKLIEKLLPKFKREMRKGTILISHGFKVEGLQKRLYKKIDHKPFPTYFYKI